MSNSINDIANLKFYTANGQELYMQKLYVMTWELIVNDSSQMKAVKEIPLGYFIGDVSITHSTTTYHLDPLTEIVDLQAGFINPGRIVLPTTYDSSTGEIIDPTTLQCYGTLYDLLDNSVNEVKVSLNIQGSSYTNVFSAKSILTMLGDSSTFKDYFEIHKVYVGDNVDSSEYYTELSFKKIDIKKDRAGVPVITSNFNKQVANLSKFFPFVRYYGTFTLLKVSTNLQAVDTVLVLEKTDNGYTRPSLAGLLNSYSMTFSPLDSNGELKIIETDNVNVIEVDQTSFSMNDDIHIADPFAFTLSVCSDTEGAYQNMIMIKLVDFETKLEFYLGAINVKTEIEAEDERFRTLMDNFGIPDPKEYLNIFADAEYSEVNKDNILLNLKSKQMFLTYSDIFSYVGTYKALFNAIRYLGYSDIIFKEWYKVIDSNDQLKELAVLVIDVENNTFLQQKLAYYGVSVEDFQKYNKLNKISMIYQINEFDDDNQEILDVSVYDPSTGKWYSSKLYFDTLLTKPIYIYRTAEVLAKLNSVKKWLEKYIIGVSAYISDVTGEGIYIGSIKTQTYNTNDFVYDYTTQQYHTPSSKQQSKLIDSSAIVQCTLAELHDNLTFEDYEKTLILLFVRTTKGINMKSKSGTSLDINMSNSNTIEAPVLGDEYAFELINKSERGTLYEWSGGKQQMYVDNDKMHLLFNELGDASIASDKLPIILLENANIHSMHGRWQENTVWVINELYDSSSEEVIYKCKNTLDNLLEDNFYATSHTQVILKPGPNASLTYTEQNKWQIPVLKISGYEFDSLNISRSDKTYAYVMDPHTEYALEIIRGDILFKKDGNVGASLVYTNDALDNPYTGLSSHNQSYQYITPVYTYYSEKMPYTVIDDASISSTLSNLFDFTTETTEMVSKHNAEIYSLLYNFKNKVNSVGDPSNPAAIDASLFIDSFNDDEFNKKYVELYELKKMYDAFLKAYNDNYIFNSSIDVNVTRIGEYETYVKSYDRYNNIYVGTTNRKTKVQALPISINTYVALKQSNNIRTFYKHNTDGEILDSSALKHLILDSSAENPNFPKSYRVYDTKFDNEDNTLIFDNINYAIETPMMKDLIIFENLSELCTDIFSGDSSTRIYMLDENPWDVIFNINDKIEICIYDNILQKDIAYYGPYVINDLYITDASTNLTISDESYIEIALLSSSETTELQAYMNDLTNRYKAYMLNNSEFEILPENIFEDTETGYHAVVLAGNQHFHTGDIIKIRTTLDENLINVSSSTLINETAYKLTDVYYSDEMTAYVYKINGRFNLNNFGIDSSLLYGNNGIDSSSMKTYMMYAHLKMVRYHTILPNDANEYIEYSGYNRNIPIIKEEALIDTTFNMVDDYIDNNYSITVYDYDNDYLNRTWLNTAVIDASIETLYRYKDFPVTIEKGNYAIFEGVDTYGTLKPGYKTSWKGTGLLLNDDKNVNLYVYSAEKETIYRSENKWLTMKPEITCSQDVQLTFIDVYGNKVVNNGEGKIFVKEAL